MALKIYHDIRDDPRLPPQIIDAVNNDSFAIFIGAGVSRLVGCWGWDKLAAQLVEKCGQLWKNGIPILNYKQRQALLNDNDHKRIITICKQLLEEKGYTRSFYSTLKKGLKGDRHLLANSNIYNKLHGLRGLFITTNVDDHFDDKFNQRIIFNEKEFSEGNIDQTYLYHIHGSIRAPESIIFSVDEYIRRYNENPFCDFLRRIFKTKTILFIGYGLTEFELLDYVITKTSSGPAKTRKSAHFMLFGYYKGEEDILELHQRYYNNLGITVVPYAMDNKGYHQLYDVVKRWHREIDDKSTFTDKSFQRMDEIISGNEDNKIDELLQIMRSGQSQQDYAFKKLAVSERPFPYLEPLHAAQYFSPEKNPKAKEVPYQKGSFFVPYWNVLGYLENVARQNESRRSPEATNILLEIINSIISYEKKQRTDNYHTDTSVTRILSHLPLSKITEEQVDFVKMAMESEYGADLASSEIGKYLLPKLVNPTSKTLLLRLLNILFGYIRTQRAVTTEYTSVMEDHWLNEALEKNKLAIIELAGPEAAEIALTKMKEIIEKDEMQFSIYSIRTIEDHEQVQFPKEYECQMVRFVRDAFRNSNHTIVEPQIRKLLTEKHPIFKRIAIDAINAHYPDLNHLFWSWPGNPLEETHLTHELYRLFEEHCSSFTAEQVDMVLGWIESKEYYVSEHNREDPDRAEKVLAYKKKEWLSALLGREDPKIQATFDKYNRLNPHELQHPGLPVWMEVGFRQPVCPISESELNKKGNADIVKYLNDFQGDKDFEFSSRGLCDCFVRCVAGTPDKYAREIEPFLQVKLEYKNALLSGFRKAWNDKRQFQLGGVFTFISEVISTSQFWDTNYGSKHCDYKDWFISTLANFVTDGTRDDSNAFDQKYLKNIETILLLIVEKVKSKEGERRDLISHVINSTKGNVFIAMINYALRYARLFSKDKKERWPETIKTVFNRRLDRNIDPSIEYSIVLGMHLPNLIWLDKDWVLGNIDVIFPKENEAHWTAAFTGYLSYSVLYANIYSLLRQKNHYDKALNTKFESDHIAERLVQHGCLGYLKGYEQLDDDTSVLSVLLKKADPEDLAEIVHFVWAFRDKLTPERQARIKVLWMSLVDVLRAEEAPDYQRAIINSYNWLCLVEEIDDVVYGLMSFSIKHIKVAYQAHSITEYLLAHVKKTPEKVAQLYLFMMDHNIYPDYKVEDIQSLVKEIYESGHKDEANTICNKYLNKNYYFLRDIFSHYNKLPD